MTPSSRYNLCAYGTAMIGGLAAFYLQLPVRDTLSLTIQEAKPITDALVALTVVPLIIIYGVRYTKELRQLSENK